jgi:hypothetical protein
MNHVAFVWKITIALIIMVLIILLIVVLVKGVYCFFKHDKQPVAQTS